MKLVVMTIVMCPTTTGMITKRPEQDVGLIVDTSIDKDEHNELDDLGDEDELHLMNEIADNEN